MNLFDSSIFDLSPIPMWLEDFSQVKLQFDRWKADGVSDLHAFLKEDPNRITLCAHQIKILQVNQKTLDLFEAQNLKHLAQNLNVIFQQEMFESHILELLQLWQGQQEFHSTAINYTLTGKRLDIKLRAVILPGSEQNWAQVLLTTEDITDYLDARRFEQQNRILAEARFQYSPTSLWVEDFSRVKQRMDHLRDIGIEDFTTFLDVHQDFVYQCVEDIVLLDVNQATLDLFKASNKQHLFQNVDKIFSKEMYATFREQLIDLWNNKIHHSREAINYALDGCIRHVLLQFTVFPGYEDNWGLVQLALTDITARKKAESYLEYLGKHDVLTQLYNRSFYTEELHRLERSIIRPVSAIYIDMNGIKKVNDQHGHDAGDELLRRMGNILNRSIANTNFSASRIGGDEFVLLMQGAHPTTVDSMLMSIQELLNIDNQYYSSHKLSIAIGYASSVDHETIEAMLKRADQAMYQQKNEFYAYLRAQNQPAEAGSTTFL